MGTGIFIANIDTQALNLKAIISVFVVIIFILAFYNLFRSNKTIKIAAFLTICGVIVISSLILLTSALDALVNVYGDKL